MKNKSVNPSPYDEGRAICTALIRASSNGTIPVCYVTSLKKEKIIDRVISDPKLNGKNNGFCFFEKKIHASSILGFDTWNPAYGELALIVFFAKDSKGERYIFVGDQEIKEAQLFNYERKKYDNN